MSSYKDAENLTESIKQVDTVLGYLKKKEQEVSMDVIKYSKNLLDNMNKEVQERASDREAEAIRDAYRQRVQLEQDLGKKLSEDEAKRILDAAKLEQAKKLENEQKLAKLEAKRKKAIIDGDIKKAKELNKEKKKEEARQKKEDQKKEEEGTNPFADTIGKAFSDFKEEMQTANSAQKIAGENLVHTMKGVGKAVMEGLNQINTAIGSYAKYQTSINTRLQGSGKTFSTLADRLSDIAFSPLINTEDLYSNLNTLVGEGIVTNVEQRASLMTMSNAIADTFEVNSATLKKLIRIQQQDSTAARLGMEGYLTRFLNEFVKSTEYLTTTFDTVADSLLEASSLMSANDSAEFEYVVQKWLGTLTGVGLSEQTAQNLASAIGQLGSGDINSLSGSSMQNLLIMGANKAGLDYANLLSNGINAAETNRLLSGIAMYMQDLGKNSTSNVVRNQLSETFGVTISDLRAVNNLSDDQLKTVFSSMMSYNDMYSELAYQASQMYEREGISNVLENLFSNFTYQTGMNIAKNPALFATWKITDLIQGVTNGINIPFVTALGSGVDLEATVENLMKLGIIGASTIGSIGDIVNGVSSAGDGSMMLDLIGIAANKGAVTELGEGLRDYVTADTMMTGKKLRRASGRTQSTVAQIGNADSAAYSSDVVNKASDQAATQLDAKKAEETTKTTLDYLVEMDFDIKFNSIVDNIRSIVDTGVKVTNLPTLATSDISSFL